MPLGIAGSLIGRVGGGSQDWQATSVAGCILWLRASLGTTLDGSDNVSVWADQSAFGDPAHNVEQATAGSRPHLNASNADFNNRATVDFDGIDNELISADFAAGHPQPLTFYIVLRYNSGDGNYAFDGNGATARVALAVGDAAASSLVYAGGGGYPTFTLPEATTLVIAIVLDGASSKVFVNDAFTPYVTGDPGANDFESLALGSSPPNAGLFMDGDIAEFIVYDGAHDAATRAIVAPNLGALYGVSIASSFDPATLSLTTFVEDCPATTPWSSLASAGTSDLYRWQETVNSTNFPTQSAPLNGHVGGVGNGTATNLKLQLDDGTNKILSDIVTASDWSVSLLVNITAISIASSSGPAGAFSNNGIMSDGAGFWGMHLRNNAGAFSVQAFVWDGSGHAAETTVPVGSLTAIQARQTGGTIEVRVDGGAWVPAASGSISSLAGQPHLFLGATSFNGTIYSELTSFSALSDADFDNILAHYTATFGY